MAKQAIGLGTSANDGTGDTLRVALDKVNDNFVELYAYLDIGECADATPTDAEVSAALGMSSDTAGVGYTKLIRHNTPDTTKYYGMVRSNGPAWIYFSGTLLT